MPNLPTLTRKIAGDPHLMAIARRCAQTQPRSLRHVGDVETADMVVYEDRATGERRQIPNKFVLSLGKLVAFELADPDSLMENNNG